MLRPTAVAVVLALSACGAAGPPADEPPLANTPPALIERSPSAPPARDEADPRERRAMAPATAPDPSPAPPDPAVLDRKIAILRELVAASTGAEVLEIQVRLYDELDRHPDAARRAEALTLATAIAADPGFAQLATADRFLFTYGDSLKRAGRAADAAAIWKQLVKSYPTSAFVPDVYVALGDAAFDDGDLASAEAFYQKATQFPKAHVAAYARYKLAWVHFNLARYQDALAGFVAVATTAGDPLRRAALKDAVRVYAEIGDPAKALPFFSRLDSGRGAELTLSLGEMLADQGKLDAAAIAFRSAASVLDDAGACRAELGLVRSQIVLGRRDQLLAGFEALAARALPGDCGDDAETLVAEVASAWHREHLTLKSDPADVIRVWELAEAVAQRPDARRTAAHAAAELRWQRAAFAGVPAQWAETAEAFHHAATLGDPDGDAAAVDAWTNAVRLDRSLAPRARLGLAPIAAAPGPAQASARALLASLPH